MVCEVVMTTWCLITFVIPIMEDAGMVFDGDAGVVFEGPIMEDAGVVFEGSTRVTHERSVEVVCYGSAGGLPTYQAYFLVGWTDNYARVFKLLSLADNGQLLSFRLALIPGVVHIHY